MIHYSSAEAVQLKAKNPEAVALAVFSALKPSVVEGIPTNEGTPAGKEATPKSTPTITGAIRLRVLNLVHI